MERLVENGYVKMIAIDVSGWESKIIDERHTNFLCDIKHFQEKYFQNPTVKCVYIHMDDGDSIIFADYQKIHKSIHPFDYMRDLTASRSGKLINGSDYLNITHKRDCVTLEEIELEEE